MYVTVTTYSKSYKLGPETAVWLDTTFDKLYSDFIHAAESEYTTLTQAKQHMGPDLAHLHLVHSVSGPVGYSGHV